MIEGKVIRPSIGLDFDGVVSAGFPVPEGAVIITGRTIEEAAKTFREMADLGVWAPVFFNTCDFKAKSDHESGSHKAKIVQLLDLREFVDDNPAQAAIVKEMARGCRVFLWKPSGAKEV